MYVYDNYYTASELIRTARDMITTKIFYPGATLIRRPFILRGKPRLKYGKGFTTGRACRIEIFGEKSDTSKKLLIGKNVHIGDYVHIAAAEHVEIGDNCLFASHVFISDLDHGSYSNLPHSSSPESDPNTRPLVTSPVRIGSNVWIGERVCVLKGVSIGNGCVIGAGAIVTHNIPANSVAIGSPARIIRQYDNNDTGWIKL